MVRKLVTATVSAALCLMPIGPAFAQDYRYSGFDAPRGATATANIRIPLGSETKAKPTYGLTFGLGQTVGADYSGRPISREIRLADIRFGSDGELKQANVASFDLANLDADKRLNMMDGGDNTLWVVVGLVAAGVAVCFVVTDCFGDDDDDESN